MAERDTMQHSSLVRWTQEGVVTVMDEAVLLGYLDINIRFGAGVTVLRRITISPPAELLYPAHVTGVVRASVISRMA